MLKLAPVISFIECQNDTMVRPHIMRRGENETVELEWKPQGKRPRGRPRKR